MNPRSMHGKLLYPNLQLCGHAGKFAFMLAVLIACCGICVASLCPRELLVSVAIVARFRGLNCLPVSCVLGNWTLSLGFAGFSGPSKNYVANRNLARAWLQ